MRRSIETFHRLLLLGVEPLGQRPGRFLGRGEDFGVFHLGCRFLFADESGFWRAEEGDLAADALN